MSMSIPSLPLTPPPTPSALSHSLSTHGFLRLTSPPPPILRLAGEVFDVSRRFFEEEKGEEKEVCRRGRGGGGNEGWVGRGVEKLDPSGKQDLKEAFNIAQYTTTPLQPFPPLLTPHTALIAQFIAECHALCMQLLEGMALSLNLPKDFFTERHDAGRLSGNTLRLLYYPEAETPPPSPSELVVRAGAHSDYGSLTLLFQQTASGLQVLLPQKGEKGEEVWLDVPAEPDTILVNVGDLMEAWTGGKWPSTIHRVVLPPGSQPAGPRLSIAYFLHPAHDVKMYRIQIAGVAHAEGLVMAGGAGVKERERADGRGKFEEGITSGEWLERRFEATYGVRSKV